MAQSDDYQFMDSTSARDSSLRPRRPELAAFDEVVSAAADGQSWAFDRLYRELSPPLLRFVDARGADDPGALVNDVLVEVFRTLPSFVGDNAALRGFAFHVARRRLIDGYRKRSRRPQTTPLDQARDNRLANPEDQPDALRSTALDQSVAMLAPLSPDQRDVIVLRVLCNLSPAETAGALDKPVSAIKALQRRGLQALRRNHPDPNNFST